MNEDKIFLTSYANPKTTTLRHTLHILSRLENEKKWDLVLILFLSKFVFVWISQIK